MGAKKAVKSDQVLPSLDVTVACVYIEEYEGNLTSSGRNKFNNFCVYVFTFFSRKSLNGVDQMVFISRNSER